MLFRVTLHPLCCSGWRFLICPIMISRCNHPSLLSTRRSPCRRRYYHVPLACRSCQPRRPGATTGASTATHTSSMLPSAKAADGIALSTELLVLLPTATELRLAHLPLATLSSTRSTSSFVIAGTAMFSVLRHLNDHGTIAPSPFAPVSRSEMGRRITPFPPPLSNAQAVVRAL